MWSIAIAVIAITLRSNASKRSPFLTGIGVALGLRRDLRFSFFMFRFSQPVWLPETLCKSKRNKSADHLNLSNQIHFFLNELDHAIYELVHAGIH
jgi:hypothetical protein